MIALKSCTKSAAACNLSRQRPKLVQIPGMTARCYQASNKGRGYASNANSLYPGFPYIADFLSAKRQATSETSNYSNGAEPGISGKAPYPRQARPGHSADDGLGGLYSRFKSLERCVCKKCTRRFVFSLFSVLSKARARTTCEGWCPCCRRRWLICCAIEHARERLTEHTKKDRGDQSSAICIVLPIWHICYAY